MSSVKRPKSSGTAPLQAVTAAVEVLEAGRPGDALALLEPLRKRFPDDPRLLRALSGALHGSGRFAELQDLLEHLSDLDPDPGIRFFLASIYARNGYLFRSLDLFEKLHKKYPEDRRSAGFPDMLASTQKMLDDSTLDVPVEERRDLLRYREELQFAVDRERWADARRVARKVLDRWPAESRTLYLQSQIELVEGQHAEAVRLGTRALQHQPRSITALATVARAHCFMGQFEEAGSYASQLLQVEATDAHAVFEKARALAIVGDYAALLVIMDEFEPFAASAVPIEAAAVRAWAGVAEIATGDEAAGRQQLEAALALDPESAFIKENLDDLQLSQEKRQGPFPIPVGDWLGTRFIRLHGGALERLVRLPEGKRKKEEATALLMAHPHLERLLGTLMERGDGLARRVALDLAMSVDRPTCNEALIHFAGTQGGPDDVRWGVVEWLHQQGRIPPDEPVRFWSQGQWEDRVLDSLPARGRSMAAAGQEAARRR